MPAPDVQMIHKHNFTTGVAVDTEANIALATAVNNQEFDVTGIIVTSYDSATSIGFWVSTAVDGTYRKLYTSANAAESITVSAVDRCYALPTGLAAFPFFKITCNAGALTVTVCRKS